MALTKLQKAIFGTRRVALESKKIAHESEEAVLMMKLPKRHATPWEGGRLAPITIVISRG